MKKFEDRNQRLKTLDVADLEKRYKNLYKRNDNHRYHKETIKNNPLQKSYLQKLDKDLSLLSTNLPKSKKVKLQTLSIQVDSCQKQENLEKALQHVNKMQNIEEIEPIDNAKSLLNKSAIMSKMGKHQQSMQLAKKALNILKEESKKFNKTQNCSQITELVVISLFNISVQLQFLGKTQEARDLYKKGLNLSLRALGSGNYLAQKMKKIVSIDKISRNITNKQQTQRNSINPEIPLQNYVVKSYKNKLKSYKEKSFFKIYNIPDKKKIVKKRVSQISLPKLDSAQYILKLQTNNKIQETNKQQKLINEQHMFTLTIV